jgi:hypothetical protein
MVVLSNQENAFLDNSSKTVYYYYNKDRIPIHKSREDYKNGNKIIVYPYSVNRITGEVRSKRIKEIEFRGWQAQFPFWQPFLSHLLFR